MTDPLREETRRIWAEIDRCGDCANAGRLCGPHRHAIDDAKARTDALWLSAPTLYVLEDLG